MARVWGIDPGGHAGWAVAVWDGSESLSPGERPFTLARHGATEMAPASHLEMLLALEAELAAGIVTAVVIEDYRPTRRQGAITWQPDALHQIGAVLYLGLKYRVPVIVQAVADAKAFGTAERLAPFRKDGVGKGGRKGSDTDVLMAVRHLLLFRSSPRGRLLT